MAINNSIEELLDQLKTIASMVMQASEADNTEQVLQEITDAARELIGSRYAALGIPDGDGGLKFFIVSGITHEEIAAIEHPPLGLGLLGMIMKDRRSLRLEHMSDHPRAVGFPKGHPHMDSFLGVPIQLNNTLFGMFYLTDRVDGKPFVAEDQWLIETLAGYAALAISNSQLREQQRELTLMQERTRIGMELHDGVIQSLYAIGMHLDVAQRAGKVGNEIPAVLDSLNDVIDDIRGYILQLSQKSQTRTMYQCLQELVQSLHIPDKLNVHLSAPEEPPPFNPNVFESICLMVNEALSNVVRHAKADNVYLKMSVDDGELVINVIDDGVGFDPAQLSGKGLGLKNLRQRASLYRGSIEIESNPDDGTSLMIQIPLRQPS